MDAGGGFGPRVNTHRAGRMSAVSCVVFKICLWQLDRGHQTAKTGAA